MPDYVWLDVIEVGRKIGVPERTFIPPVPGETHMVTVQDWDGVFLQKAITCIAPYRQKGGTVVITGHVDAWVIIALGNSLKPECEIMYGAGLNGPGSTPVATPLIQLRMGKKNPRLRFDYTMWTEGENCYMDYRVDDPDAPPGTVHTFNNNDLPDLVLPVIPKGKNLFLYAQACYYVQVNVSNSYTKYAKSVSTAYHDCPDYHCAYSSGPEMKAGDTTPRSLEKKINWY